MGKPAKPVNNVKTRASKTALGQFWGPSDGIFSRVPRKKVESWSNVRTDTFIPPLAICQTRVKNCEN